MTKAELDRQGTIGGIKDRGESRWRKTIKYVFSVSIPTDKYYFPSWMHSAGCARRGLSGLQYTFSAVDDTILHGSLNFSSLFVAAPMTLHYSPPICRRDAEQICLPQRPSDTLSAKISLLVAAVLRKLVHDDRLFQASARNNMQLSSDVENIAYSRFVQPAEMIFSLFLEVLLVGYWHLLSRVKQSTTLRWLRLIPLLELQRFHVSL